MYGPWSAVKAKAAAHEIMGTSSVTVDQMVSYYNKRYTFPADIYRDKGADSAEAFFKILKEEAEAEGVRADVLFAQVMLETGGLKFGRVSVTLEDSVQSVAVQQVRLLQM